MSYADILTSITAPAVILYIDINWFMIFTTDRGSTAGETAKELIVFGSGEFTPTKYAKKMYILNVKSM